MDYVEDAFGDAMTTPEFIGQHTPFSGQIAVALLCDIFGNPFRPITLDAVHRTPTIASLARAAYDERQLPSGELNPHRLGVLADALEEADAPTGLVAHLRGPGPHVRGCFPVDLCLGLS